MELPRTRHTAGGPSARSLLVTILGEYAMPDGVPVRSRVLVDALGTLGIEEKAARQAIGRLARDGWLARAGGARSREVSWTVADPGRAVLAEEAARFARSFRDRDRGPWDGRWLLVMATVPETKRQLRRKLHARLAFEGFGSLGQGWWISADPGAEDAARHLLERLGVLDGATSFVARSGALGGGDLVASAFDLAEARARYEDLVAELSATRPRDEAGAFAARTRAVNQWRRALAADPRLPAELLPPAWVGERAADLFRRCYARWHAPAADWWRAATGSAS